MIDVTWRLVLQISVLIILVGVMAALVVNSYFDDKTKYMRSIPRDSFNLPPREK